MSRVSDWSARIIMLVIILMGAVAVAGQVGGNGKGNGGQGGEQGHGGGERHEKKRAIYGRPKDRHAFEMLLDESDDDAEVQVGTNKIERLKGRFRLDKSKPVDEAALDFIDKHKNAFGLKNPKIELRREGKIEGGKNFSYQQYYNNIPVLGVGIGIGAVAF